MENGNSAFSNFLLDVDGFIKGKEGGFKIQSLNQKFSNERDFTNALITEVLLEGGFHQIIHDFYIFHELLSEILGENISLKSGHEGVGNKSMSKEDKKKVHKINDLMKPFLNDIPASQCEDFIQDINQAVADTLQDKNGIWYADYVRLRFNVIKNEKPIPNA